MSTQLFSAKKTLVMFEAEYYYITKNTSVFLTKNTSSMVFLRKQILKIKYLVKNGVEKMRQKGQQQQKKR